MKIGRYIILFAVVAFAGCGGPKSLTSLVENAKNESAQGNYTQAVVTWQQYFNQKPIEDTDGATFAMAAESAFLARNNEQAVQWFNQARYKNYADAPMYATLAKIYRLQDNLSKELDALEFYVENYNENLDEINNRLFEVYYETETFDKALILWDKLNEAQKNELSNQEKFFLINAEKGNTVVSDSLSTIILRKDPQNVNVLEWEAKKYYWLAENRYQKQMKEYNAHKTTKQYKILLEQLDLVTADFKKALPYFEKLWKIEPGKKYASYMANIYARFGDEKKADYYKKYMN